MRIEFGLIRMALSSPVLPELCFAGASLNPDLISVFLLH